ncbi:MAG: polyphosphate--glucose phosphotransferase [Chloroflexota bacterium]
MVKSKPKSDKSAAPKGGQKAAPKAAQKPAQKRAPATANSALGIDVGGTGVKAALVDVTTGELLSRRHRVSTPKPSTPEAIAEAVKQIVGLIAAEIELPLELPVGIGIPGAIKGGVVLEAPNLDKRWIGTNGEEVIGKALGGRRVVAINDADAAGLAEVRYGAGRDVAGTVLMLTIGTGIGSGLFVNGRLVPNTELGHIEFRGRDAELLVSGLARERRHLRWHAWANEFSAFLARIERYLWPDLIILGGGVSKELKKYQRWLVAKAPIVPAQFLNTAGIVGAALYATDRLRAESARPSQPVAAKRRRTAS